MFTWNAKLILKISRLFKHLDAMVVGVGDDNVLVHAETEAMWRIELAFSRAKLTKLAPINIYISAENLQHAENLNTVLKSQ